MEKDTRIELTEERVREIVREELARLEQRMVDFLNKGLQPKILGSKESSVV